MLYVHGHAHARTPVHATQPLDALCVVQIVFCFGWESGDGFPQRSIELVQYKVRVLHQFLQNRPRRSRGAGVTSASWFTIACSWLQEIGTALTCFWIVVETVFCWKTEADYLDEEASRFRDVQYAICYHNNSQPRQLLSVINSGYCWPHYTHTQKHVT